MRLGAVMLAGVLGLTFFLAGCRERKVVVHEQRVVVREREPVVVHEREPVVVYEREPVVIERVVVVPEPPPRVRVEVRTVRPSRDHIWVDGYWNWHEHSYVWIGGRWGIPPQRGRVWVAPRYERAERGGHYTSGHWR